MMERQWEVLVEHKMNHKTANLNNKESRPEERERQSKTSKTRGTKNKSKYMICMQNPEKAGGKPKKILPQK